MDFSRWLLYAALFFWLGGAEFKSVEQRHMQNKERPKRDIKMSFRNHHGFFM